MHLCLAFEPLREPLWLFQQRGGANIYSSDSVKAIMRYMLKGLEYLQEREEPSPRKLVDDRWIYLSRNDFGPPGDSFVGRLRIIDFDCAVWDDESRAKDRLIQANDYRAPEVILGSGWTYSVDIWNLGVMVRLPFSTQCRPHVRNSSGTFSRTSRCFHTLCTKARLTLPK